MEGTTGIPEFHVQPISIKFDEKSGQTVFALSKNCDIPMRLHRDILDDATIEQVTVKKEPSGEWFATFGVEVDRNPAGKGDNPESRTVSMLGL